MIAVGTAQWYWRIQLAGWSLILYHFLVMQSVNCLTAPLSKQRASCMHWHLKNKAPHIERAMHYLHAYCEYHGLGLMPLLTPVKDASVLLRKSG